MNPVKCYYPHFSEEEAMAQKVLLLLIEPIVATSVHSHTATRGSVITFLLPHSEM